MSSCSQKPRAASDGHSSFPWGAAWAVRRGDSGLLPALPPLSSGAPSQDVLGSPSSGLSAVSHRHCPQFQSLYPRMCWAEHQSWGGPRSASLYHTCPLSGRKEHTCLTCVPLPLWCGPWMAWDLGVQSLAQACLELWERGTLCPRRGHELVGVSLQCEYPSTPAQGASGNASGAEES